MSINEFVAEKVIGIDLTPSRDRQKEVIAGEYITGSNGKGGITLINNGIAYPPPYHSLPEPAPDCVDKMNGRYYIWVVDNVFNKNGEIEDEINAIRNEPKKYDTDISAAWDVVNKLTSDDAYVRVNLNGRGDLWYVDIFKLGIANKENVGFNEEPAPLPMAICLAALMVVGYTE